MKYNRLFDDKFGAFKLISHSGNDIKDQNQLFDQDWDISPTRQISFSLW